MELSKSTITYAHAKLNIEDYWNRGITGKGIKIGIVDDGMEPHDAIDLAGGYACGAHTTYLVEHYHSMHCAGIAAGRNLQNGEPAGIAPDSSIYSIRMYYKSYEDRVKSLIEAIDFAIEEGIDILSMSIHINENSSNQHTTSSHSGTPKHLRLALRNAFHKAYEHGIIIFVAAGNRAYTNGEVRDNIEFLELLPKQPNVVAVANMTMEDVRRRSSGVGDFVDISGYGTYIRATNVDNGYATRSGTSMATPQIAGVYALYKQLFTNLNPQEVLGKMFDNCVTLPIVTKEEQGRGVPMPPEELYSRNLVTEAEGQLRVYSEYTWKAIDAYYKDGNSWKEMEAVVNG